MSFARRFKDLRARASSFASSPRVPVLAFALLLAAAVLLQILTALATPIGHLNDDAVYLLLARALWRGTYVLPNGLNFPVTSYWPGAPLLWLLPVHVFEPRWGWCRLVALACSWTALGLTWRLARRRLPAAWAAAALLFVAWNPVFLRHAGVCSSDMPFLVLSLAAFCALPDRGRRKIGTLEFAAAAACLTRPEGVLLAASLALTVGWREGLGRAAALLAAALAPLGAWLAYNRLVSGKLSDYLPQLVHTHLPSLWDGTSQLGHAVDVCAGLFGHALLGLPLVSKPALAVAGLLALSVAGLGAARRLRRQDDPHLLAVAAYAWSVIVLHLLWWQVFDRYVLSLLPLLWILILIALKDDVPKPRQRWLLVPAAAFLILRIVLTVQALPPRRTAEPEPETMAWIRANVPESSLIQSAIGPSIMLWTGRRAINLIDNAPYRDHWLAICLHNHVEYFVLDENPMRWYLNPPNLQELLRTFHDRVRSSRYISECFRSPGEKTAVYRLRHPDPARFLRASDAFLEAVRSPPGTDPGLVRAKLRESVRLEPEFAIAWAVLAAMDPEPAADVDRRKALRADPTLRLPARSR